MQRDQHIRQVKKRAHETRKKIKEGLSVLAEMC
jgi:hypothetical protein